MKPFSKQLGQTAGQSAQPAGSSIFETIGTNTLVAILLDLPNLPCGETAKTLSLSRDRDDLVATAVRCRIDANHAMPNETLHRLLCRLPRYAKRSVKVREKRRTTAHMAKDALVRGPYRRKFGERLGLVHLPVPSGQDVHHQAFDVVPEKITVTFINHG